jgi:hypothetical protein
MYDSARDVELLDARSTSGQRYALALSWRDQGIAYVLTKDQHGAWRCRCLHFEAAGSCPHTRAALLHERARERERQKADVAPPTSGEQQSSTPAERA